MGLLKNIQWDKGTANQIVFKFDMKNDHVAKGSALTVREGQAAIFCHKGKMADVFSPGFYKLDTNSIPVLTKLMSWKYGFENPFRSEIFYVNTTQFTNQKWGTPNPIIIRDRDYGAVRVRGFGSYSFRVSDPFIFMTELTGTLHSYKTEDLADYLRSKCLSAITDAIGEGAQKGIGILDLAGNLLDLGQMVQWKLQDSFNSLGLTLTKFVFESFSLPEELQKALDENIALGMKRTVLDVHTQMAQLDALKAAASNPGAGNVMGPAMGMGMGFGMGNMFGGMMQNQMMNNPMMNPNMMNPNMMNPAMMNQGMQQPPATPQQGGSFCTDCGTQLPAGTKFCSGCGKKLF
ncbi:MAG: SPFH domain-containing protein [Firmicutes bacterium]|nr:SPFH domain-containing protein [Bacillota bacterium]